MDSEVNIPQKSLFKVEEICSLTGVKPYVLRFWEAEFEEIAPFISSSGQKLYELKDIEAVSVIKKLLFEEKMTIERARVRLKEVLAENKIQKKIAEMQSRYHANSPQVPSTTDTTDTTEPVVSSPESVNVSTQEIRIDHVDSVAANHDPLSFELEKWKKNHVIDTEKVYQAKQKINELVAMAVTVKERHHWT